MVVYSVESASPARANRYEVILGVEFERSSSSVRNPAKPPWNGVRCCCECSAKKHVEWHTDGWDVDYDPLYCKHEGSAMMNMISTLVEHSDSWRSQNSVVRHLATEAEQKRSLKAAVDDVSRLGQKCQALALVDTGPRFPARVTAPASEVIAPGLGAAVLTACPGTGAVPAPVPAALGGTFSANTNQAAADVNRFFTLLDKKDLSAVTAATAHFASRYSQKACEAPFGKAITLAHLGGEAACHAAAGLLTCLKTGGQATLVAFTLDKPCIADSIVAYCQEGRTLGAMVRIAIDATQLAQGEQPKKIADCCRMLNGLSNCAVFPMSGPNLAEYQRRDGRNATGGRGFMHIKMIRVGHLVIRGSANWTTHSSACEEWDSVEWLTSEGHAEYEDLERRLFQNVAPYAL